MLFRQDALDGIQTGRITLAFRRWQRPTVRAGGSLLTPIGQLAIGAVEIVAPAAITAAEARAAGFSEVQDLLAELSRRTGDVYRIELGPLRPDPRIALRSQVPDESDLSAIASRLARLDARAPAPWTHQVLRLVRDRPGVRAGDLARSLGMERDPFKVNVRKLKALGLTESLEVGYRLSARGEAVLDRRGDPWK